MALNSEPMNGQPFGSGQPTKEDLGNYGMAELYAGANGMTASQRERYKNLIDYYTHQGDLEWQAAQTELEWSRNSPAAQLQQLMALGMTRSAALQAIQGGTANQAQAPAASPASGSQSPLREIGNAIGIMASTVSGAVGLYQSCKMFGQNYQYMQAQAKLMEANAYQAQQIADGANLAGSFWNEFQQSAKDLGEGFDPKADTKSIPAMFSTIERAAEKSDRAKQWLSQVRPLYDGNIFAQQYSNGNYMSWMATRGWQAVEDDQDWIADMAFAQSEQEQLRVQSLIAENARTEAETLNIEAQTSYTKANEDYLRHVASPAMQSQQKLTEAQTRGQILANRALSCDVSIKEATYQEQSALALQQIYRETAILKGCRDKGMYEDIVSRMVSDEKAAAVISGIYKDMRVQDPAYWKAHPEEYSLACVLTSPSYVEMLKNYALEDQVTNNTVTTKAGPVSLTTRTANAAWLYSLIKGEPQKQQGMFDAWSPLFEGAERQTWNGFWQVP